MNSQDNGTGSQPAQDTGGVTMAEPVFVAPQQPDTIVIPASDAPSQAPAGPAELPQNPSTASNPFIPGVVPAQSGNPGSGGLPFIRILVLVGILIALVVAGIFIFRLVSGSQDTGGEPIGGTGAPPVKNVTITYWGLWENDSVVRQFIADFEAKNPGITVQYTMQSPKQYRERLQSAINRGEGPDVFRFHNTWVPMLRRELAPVPARVMSAADFSNTFFPVAVNDLVAGTTVYGIPLMTDGLGLYINEDLLTAAGVPEPTTWTDIINIIPKLTVKNGTAIVTGAIALGTTNNVEHFSDILALMFLQNGANLVAPGGTEAEGTLIFYRKFADPADPLYTWSDGMDNSVSAFANGRVAMILAPSWRAHEIHGLNGKLRFRIIPVPQLQGSSVTWASYWVEGVSAKSNNQDAAWKFVQYLTGSEGATKLYTAATATRLFGEPYARIDLASSIASDPYAGAFVRQAQTARSFPLASRTHDNGINDRLIQYLTNAVNGMAGGSAPTQVLVTMSQGFRQVLSSYGINTGTEPTAAP